ncbi:MAG: STAS domain-containing protein [Acidobacteriota bacterium]
MLRVPGEKLNIEPALSLQPDITIYKLTGRLSLANGLEAAEKVIRQRIAEGVRKLVLDLTTLDYIDSSGIGTLISCNGQMEQAGGVMRVAGAKGAVAQTFRLVHLDRIVPLDDSVEASCASLRDNTGGRLR